MLSGVTKLIITKADVLDELETLYAGVAYDVDGVVSEEMPFDLNTGDVQPILREFEGWHTSITSCTNATSLPIQFQNYLRFVANYLNVGIEMVSNGTGRDQIIELGDSFGLEK